MLPKTCRQVEKELQPSASPLYTYIKCVFRTEYLSFGGLFFQTWGFVLWHLYIGVLSPILSKRYAKIIIVFTSSAT